MARRLVMLMAAAGLALAVAAAQPAPGPQNPQGREGQGPGPRRPQARMMEKLNLNDQQKSQMQKLRSSFQKKEIETQAKIKALRVDLREAAMADNPDRGSIEKIVSNISDLQQHQKMDFIDHLFAVKGILTPDQQKIWKAELMRIGEESQGRPRGRMRWGNG